MTRFHQQGDVGLLPVGKLPQGAVCIQRGGPIILAYGEATGHKHQVVGKTISLWEADGQRYVVVEDNVAEVLHEEHGSHTLDVQVYEYRPQRELDLREEERRVVD